MRRFSWSFLNWKTAIMSLLINMFVIVVASLLPGFNFIDQRLIVLALAAFFLGLLNTFVKPILQLITIRVMFTTYGLILVVTQTVILLLLGWLFQNTIEIRSLITAVLAALIISLLSWFLDYMFGVVPPLGYFQAMREEEYSS